MSAKKVSKLNLGCGPYRLEGFVNLDIKRGWKFQDGLPAYADNSVEAITISHALMFLTEEELGVFLAEAYRALMPGGIIRITEDNTEHPLSDTYQKGWKTPPCLTGPAMMNKHLWAAGFTTEILTKDTTNFKDNSLLQNNGHELGNPLRVFFIEGRK